MTKAEGNSSVKYRLNIIEYTMGKEMVENTALTQGSMRVDAQSYLR